MKRIDLRERKDIGGQQENVARKEGDIMNLILIVMTLNQVMRVLKAALTLTPLQSSVLPLKMIEDAAKESPLEEQRGNTQKERETSVRAEGEAGGKGNIEEDTGDMSLYNYFWLDNFVNVLLTDCIIWFS